MINRIQKTFKITFLSLWNSWGLIGRLITLPIALILFIILFLIELFKLTFIWAYKLIKIFFAEFTFFLKKCANSLDNANDLLDELFIKKVFYYIKKITCKIIETPFSESKKVLTKNWFFKIIWFLIQSLFWGFCTIFLFLITFSGIIYFTGSAILGLFTGNIIFSLVLKLTILFPIPLRMIRLKTIKINQSEFWISDINVISEFKKRHLAYVLLAIVMIGGIIYTKIS